jgi:DNA-binding transcriptional LysR family regulator
MPMNLNQLTYFVTLAQIEHYTKAAKCLSITQPSLSHAISSLEEELEVPLFERNGRNVTLTHYGKIFLQYVEESLQILNTGVEKIRETAQIAGGQISLGYIYTQGSEFIPQVVKSFLNALKKEQSGGQNDGNIESAASFQAKQEQLLENRMGIDFQFHNDVTSNLIQGLKEGKYDVIFCSKVTGEREINFLPVAKEKLVAIVPLSHPLAKKNSVTLKELGQYPQISFPPSSGLYFVIHDLFEQENIEPNTVFEVEEDSALAGMVAEGFGVGIIPDIASVRHLPIRRIQIEDLTYRRYVYMATRKNHTPSLLVEKFVEFIEKNYGIHKPIL